jgi:hypothetical protein
MSIYIVVIFWSIKYLKQARALTTFLDRAFDLELFWRRKKARFRGP